MFLTIAILGNIITIYFIVKKVTAMDIYTIYWKILQIVILGGLFGNLIISIIFGLILTVSNLIKGDDLAFMPLLFAPLEYWAFLFFPLVFVLLGLFWILLLRNYRLQHRRKRD